MTKRVSEVFRYAEDVRKCAGCGVKFVPTISKRFCNDCKTEIEAMWEAETERDLI